MAVVNTHLVLAEADNVDVDLLLLELLGQLDQVFLVSLLRLISFFKTIYSAV